MVTELERRRNVWAIRKRHYGVSDPRTVEAERALVLGLLAAARDEVAQLEARAVALLLPGESGGVA